MPRDVDPKRTRKALKSLQALKEAAAAAQAEGAPFSEWEDTFITEVGERLEKFGSAFADYGKGAPDEALSRLQQQKLQELRKKARAKTPKLKMAGTAQEPAADQKPRWGQSRLSRRSHRAED